MTPFFKGILVVLIAIGLWAVACNVKAGTEKELNALLGDKVVVYVGTCYFKEDGKLTFKHAEMKTNVPCIVGMDVVDGKLDSTNHYVMLMDGNNAVALIVYREKDQSQETLWRRGKTT